MATFKFTNRAVKDLSEILDYTVKTWSEKQAEKYYQLLDSMFGNCKKTSAR
ncbi:MAG: hypothetical protein GC193_08630 [Cryomorphaceae bacterium]|nr:hypothetical protein [Cryomorphaceae bacterium]